VTPIVLSRDEARRAFLFAQSVLGVPDRRAGVAGLVRRLGAVQLDTISVLARSHELVAYSRLGPVGRASVEQAYWGSGAGTFEYWAHAACILPIEYWPYFEFRRRRSIARWDGQMGPTRREVTARLRAEGPLTATDLGGAKKKGPWWDWSDVKRALEVMLAEGEVECMQRRGWKRVYDLAERAIPENLLNHVPEKRECLAFLVDVAARRLGVATNAQLAEYFRLQAKDMGKAVHDAGLVPVEVRGWGDSAPGRPAPSAARARGNSGGPRRSPGVSAWAHPSELRNLEGGSRRRHRTTLLSPFDSLIWDRDRTKRIFGFTHRIEAYVPKPKRVHGYYAMPLLAGGRLVGRVDPGRSGSTLVARQVSVKPNSIGHMARALTEAATWISANNIVLERIEPDSARAGLEAELGEAMK
jgi:uncharacterized protein YcaQ